MPKQTAAVRAVDYRSLAEFRYELRRFLKWSEDAARSVGLEPQQHQLMLAIKGLPPGTEASVRYLSERMLVKHHSTVELIDRLDARGLVRRQRSTEDRRRISVRPHAEGRASAREALPPPRRDAAHHVRTHGRPACPQPSTLTRGAAARARSANCRAASAAIRYAREGANMASHYNGGRRDVAGAHPARQPLRGRRCPRAGVHRCRPLDRRDSHRRGQTSIVTTMRSASCCCSSRPAACRPARRSAHRARGVRWRRLALRHPRLPRRLGWHVRRAYPPLQHRITHGSAARRRRASPRRCRDRDLLWR